MAMHCLTAYVGGNRMPAPDTKPAIAPALTPEEWEDLVVDTSRHDLLHLRDDDLHINGDDDGAVCDRRARHAVAALALHEQEFGFTQKDVDDLLRTMDFRIPGPSLRDLAARIAALLPPAAARKVAADEVVSQLGATARVEGYDESEESWSLERDEELGGRS